MPFLVLFLTHFSTTLHLSFLFYHTHVFSFSLFITFIIFIFFITCLQLFIITLFSYFLIFLFASFLIFLFCFFLFLYCLGKRSLSAPLDASNGLGKKIKKAKIQKVDYHTQQNDEIMVTKTFNFALISLLFFFSFLFFFHFFFHFFIFFFFF